MTLDSQAPDPNLAPPLFPRPVPKESLAPEFQSVLMRLEQRYGAALRVNVTDAQWVEINVENIPAAILNTQLQSQRKMLFGSADDRVQVISPLRPTGNSIYLHLLTEPEWGNPRSMMMMSK